jgi:sarcosine oxidase subunit alpha
MPVSWAWSQNRWPSLRFDIGAINDVASRLIPAGFYYKTFMWPPTPRWWLRYEHLIRHAAGMGRAASLPDPDAYEHQYGHCDVLVIGAGPAGLAAARAAAHAGARVLLCDENPVLGGSLVGGNATIDGLDAASWLGGIVSELAAFPEVTLLSRTTAFGYYDGNLVGLLERVADHVAAPPEWTPRQRLWKVRAKSVVLASGAHERGIAFANNDLPGTLLAGAARTYVERYAVRPGSRAVVFTNNDSAYATALALAGAGVDVAAIVDPRSGAALEGALPLAARDAGLPIVAKSVVVGAHGGCASTRWTSCRKPAAPRGVSIAISSPSPAVGTRRSISTRRREAHAPLRRCARDVRSRGSPHRSRRRALPTDTSTLPRRWGKGMPQGMAAAMQAGFRAGAPLASPHTCAGREWSTHAAVERPAGRQGSQALRRLAERRHGRRHRARRARRLPLRRASQALHDARHGHRPGQACPTSSGLALLAEELGVPIGSVGTTTFRPPYTPVALGAFPGIDTGAHVEPTRYSAMHDWHLAHGARFVNAGLWKRPHSYPRPGESADDAAFREARNVRANVGIVDVSTLGKIELQGKDVARIPEPRLHQPLGYAPVGPLPLWRDAARRRHRVRRRHGVASRADALPDDDDDGQRRQGAAASRNAAAGRLAGARGVRDVGDRAMGGRRGVRPGCALRARENRRHRRGERGLPVSRRRRVPACAPPWVPSRPGFSG